MTATIYLMLATAMFFLQDTYFSLGGVDFSLKNPCILAILFLALLNFIATVRLDRTFLLARHMVVQALPFFIPFFFSAVIWVIGRADAVTVVNGTGMILPQLLSVCVAAATLYLFGSRGMWYCLGAMCTANLLRVLVVVAVGGPSVFFQEFLRLLATFSAETGDLMIQLEINDLTFAFGPFLIYLLLNRKETRHWLFWMLSVSLFFFIGLKRIAVPAVALGVLVALLVRRLPEKAAAQTALGIAAGMMVVSFFYIVGIRMGLFQYLQQRLGINTMGRVEMFNHLEPYYDISITYLGRGTGFERFVDWASGVVYDTPRRTIMQIHNDFLRMYLNIGFIGYWVWLWGTLVVRLRYWFSEGRKEAGSLFLGISIYCFVLYATDNTIYYPYTLLACAIVPMAYHMDEMAEKGFTRRCEEWSGNTGQKEKDENGFQETGRG